MKAEPPVHPLVADVDRILSSPKRPDPEPEPERGLTIAEEIKRILDRTS